LIVSDFMVWANEQRIPTGVRGSGATSLLAWCMGITHLDPIRFNLVFERFLNPERVSLPDFDVDFCQKQRAKVIDYVVEKYGRDCVCQIITFGKLQAKASVRDAGRVIQAPYRLVDRISKLVGDANTISAAISDEPDLANLLESDETARDIIENARRIEGKVRNISTHAAGVIISDKPVVNYLPLYKDASSDMPRTQFHFKDAEAVGLVKFDFLGLRTLTIIAEAVDLVEKTLGERISPLELEFEDGEVFEMLASGDSTGVFQLESPGMRELLKSMKPSQIEHLIALISLYRPGPMDSIPSYVARANGEESIEYDHPLLEEVLKETFGIVTYQEDVMRIARDLGGYSLGEADLLRRAMGKKIVSEMDAHRKKFCDGALDRGVPERVSNLIFDKCAKFAGYGFNKGHAAAYAQVSFQTAYLKFHHPAQFYCACMNVDIDSHERLRLYCNELRQKKIAVLPPCVNRSNAVFVIEQIKNQFSIRYGLAGVRNFGWAAADSIAQERSRNGAFSSIDDFFKRTSPLGISRSGYLQLLLAGAFKCFGKDPRHISEQLDALIANGRSVHDEEENIQSALFDAHVGIEPTNLADAVGPITEFDLEGELSSLGFFLSAHPLEILNLGWSNREISISDVRENVGDAPKSTSVLARVDGVQFRTSKKSGKKYSYVVLSDPSGELECMAFEREGGLRVQPDDVGKIVRASVESSRREGRNSFSLRGWVEAKNNKRLVAIKFFAETEDHVQRLKAAVSALAPGDVKVLVAVKPSELCVIEIDTGKRLKIDMRSYSRIARDLWDLGPVPVH
jgi:DNA polymerase III subunit alpha